MFHNHSCERCNKPTFDSIMSKFNTQMICTECKTIEKAHPSYQRASDAEVSEVRSGNYNFEGIGLPDELR